MAYARYMAMIANMRAPQSLWRLALGLATVLVVLAAWGSGLNALVAPQSDQVITAVHLLAICGFGVGTWIAARVWQKRGLASLTGHAPKVLRDFAIASAVTFAFGAAIFLWLLSFDPPIRQYGIGEWIMWVPLALGLIAFQTGAEELLFRGYLQSQLAARFASPFVWLFGPALLFGAAHFVPNFGIKAGLVYVAATALFGLIAGDLTARTGTIGAAWGLHFANNCIALLLVAQIGALSGLGLYTSGHIADTLNLSGLLLVDLAAMVATWAVIRRLVVG